MLATAIEPHLAAAFSSEPRGRTLARTTRPRPPEPGFCLGRCFVLLPTQVGSGEILISADHHIALDLVGCAGLADLVVEAGSLGVLWQAPRVTQIVHEHYAAISEIDTIETIGANQPFYLFEPVTRSTDAVSCFPSTRMISTATSFACLRFLSSLLVVLISPPFREFGSA